jgi:large conductance mechanosensitive channel
MLKGFKEFISRGNVVDLAVAVVIGAAFAAVIKAVLDGLITPFIAAIFGEPDLSRVGTFTINDADFSIGLVLNALFYFLVVAAAIYFLVILPMNKMKEMQARKAGEPEEAASESELDVLRQIRDQLRARD